MKESPQQISQLLAAWGKGNQAALDQLIPLVYGELRRMARRYMAGQPPGHTLQTTALINEAYLKLAGQDDKHWENRAHFFGVAAQAMRHILVDRIEVLRLQKRTYPRGWNGPIDLAFSFNQIGQSEQAIAEARESIRLSPNVAAPYRNLALALLRVSRFEEAKDILAQAQQQKLDHTDFHYILYQIAGSDDDTAGMQQQIDWASGKPEEYVHLTGKRERPPLPGSGARRRNSDAERLIWPRAAIRKRWPRDTPPSRRYGAPSSEIAGRPEKKWRKV